MLALRRYASQMWLREWRVYAFDENRTQKFAWRFFKRHRGVMEDHAMELERFVDETWGEIGTCSGRHEPALIADM